MNAYYTFHTRTSPSLAEVGGKAKALVEMTQAGFPVPAGFVLSVQFFDSWLTEIQQSAEWKDFVISSSQEVKHYCDAVKRRAQRFSFDAVQRQLLMEALRSFPQTSLLAVRSSSPEEDLAGTSFAGGYETTLGVTHSTLEDAILHSFISVFDERIVKYKIQHKMKTDTPRIAVIVQQQIASEVSGVAFSLNPQNNCYDEAVINANFGLGETIVAGQVTPDTFIVEKVKQELLGKTIATKSHARWLLEDGGTKETKNEIPASQTLTDEQALQVAELTTKSEHYYGKPMDIEWAYEADTLYLLQARPITTYLSLPPEAVTKRGEQKYLYLDAMLVEQGISQPMSVMGAAVYEDIMNVLMKREMGTNVIGVHDGLSFCADGKLYVQVSNMVKTFGKTVLKKVYGSYDLPTKNILAYIDYAEYIPAKKPKKLRGVIFKFIPIGFKMAGAFLQGYLQPKRTLALYKERMRKDLEAYRNFDIHQGSFNDTYRAFMNLYIQHLDAIFPMLSGPLLAKYRLGKLFKNDDVKDLLVALNLNLPGNPTAAMGRAMYVLASFADVRECPDGETFAKRIQDRSFSKEFVGAYDDYMQRFGCRCINEIDPATPRLYENPELFFEQITRIQISKDGEDDIFTLSEKKQKSAYDELLIITEKLGKKRAFIKNAQIIRNAGGYREVPKYYLVMWIDVLRKKTLLVGQQFVEQGRLDNAQQMFSLSIEEIKAAEDDVTLELRTRIGKNTAYAKKVRNWKDWPRVIDSRGKIFRAKREPQAEGEFIGDPIAPGIIRGRAKVLFDPYEKAIEKGEILVTHATDPGWTPIFINAAGVVLEVGGPLQHGAIIAREYGLPCVSGIDHATEIIKDGNIIEVDGSSGIVKLIEQSTHAHETSQDSCL